MTPGDARQALLARGVEMPLPDTVLVGEDIAPERIAPGVVLHPGCRLHGASTSIGPGSILGEEQPVTVMDCQLGHGVRLKGGFFERATFLDGASLGSGAHVRSGTLLEEEANGAHTVGLKQTILFPYATLGSLINFCDCLMAGGTSRRNHSEVGSSYVHFNYTPHQDKATASLIGDVPRGVMLDQPPVFLGGQGGLVGPCRLAFGTVVAAGAVCRKDQEEAGHLVIPHTPAAGARAYPAGMYGDVRRIVVNNLAYIGNVRALQAWYLHARGADAEPDAYRKFCLDGAAERLREAGEERVKRLGQLAGNMAVSLEALAAAGNTDQPAYRSQQALQAAWPELKAALGAPPGDPGTADRDVFLAGLRSTDAGCPWTDRIRLVPAEARAAGTRWLQAVVDTYIDLWHPSLPGA